MDEDDGRGGITGAAARLEREFRDWFAVCPILLHDGLSLIARRIGGGTVPGLHTLITPDESEMRQALSREVT